MENTQNQPPRRPNPRRRRRSRAQIFRQTYLPVIIVALIVVLFIIFAVGSIKRSNAKREAARESSIAAMQSEAEKQLLYEQEASRLMVEADAYAKRYDFDGAIAVLDSFQGNIYDFNDLLERRDTYERIKGSLVAWDDPSKIVNLGFHLLVSDASKAFEDKEYGRTYSWNFITTEEFSAILSQLYKNNYVLVDFDDIITTVIKEDGTTAFTAKTLYLPEGKTPFMLSQTQVNYFTYMTDSNNDGMPDRGGDGFAYKMTVDRNGGLTNAKINSTGDTVTGSYDVVPILEDFIAANPDFSYQGARGTLSVCAYDGLFGYRTDPETKTKIGADYYDQELADIPNLLKALTDHGYTIGCNTYGNVAYGNIGIDTIREDLSKWKAEATPILGDVHVLAFAKNSDIAPAGESYEGEKFEALKNAGFNYFLGFCDDGKPWIEINDGYVRQGRLMVTGSNLEANGHWFESMFDADTVLDSDR